MPCSQTDAVGFYRLDVAADKMTGNKQTIGSLHNYFGMKTSILHLAMYSESYKYIPYI